MEYPPYVHPCQSVLADHHEEIAAIRGAGWPYQHIANWLRQHRNVATSTSAVRRYCLRVHLSKPRVVAKKASNAQPAPAVSTSREFRCDDFHKPIPIQRN